MQIIRIEFTHFVVDVSGTIFGSARVKGTGRASLFKEMKSNSSGDCWRKLIGIQGYRPPAR